MAKPQPLLEKSVDYGATHPEVNKVSLTTVERAAWALEDGTWSTALVGGRVRWDGAAALQ